MALKIPKNSKTSGSVLTYEERMYLAVQYYILSDLSVLDRIKAVMEKRGRPLKGYPQMVISQMVDIISKGCDSNDPLVCGLLRKWGVDPAKPIDQQDQEQIQAAMADNPLDV